MWRTITVFALLLAATSPYSTVHLAQAQQPKDESKSFGNTLDLANMIRKDFKDCLIEPSQPKPRLYAQDSFEFSGDAQRLNAFLSQLVKLSNDRSVIIYLCGPNESVARPLTSADAQLAVEYDWKVKTLAENISVFIPLASRIPFADMRFPQAFRVQAEPAVAPLTEEFLRLREQECGELDRLFLPKE